jgi:uncharacterized protein YfaS (alpha-2-macroglobulin family)
MRPSGRIWLAGAYSFIEGRADALRALGSGDSTMDAAGLDETLDSLVRNAAQLLSLWTEVEPRSVEATELVQKLLLWSKENRWYSTQENSTVVMALGRYLLKTGYEKNSLDGALMDGDRSILAFRSGASAAVEVKELLETPLLRIRTAGSGSGYYNWVASGNPSSAPKPERRGISVECVWRDRQDNPFLKGVPIPQGTEVIVTLTLSPGALSVSDVALSYLLPAGMELENPRLTDSGAPQMPGVRYDIRDDRLLIFVDRLYQATEYKFAMRAVTKGTFVRPPLAAEGMYDPSVRFVGEMEEAVTIK